MGSQYGIGGTLRAERMRQKRSIEDVSRETRISSRMLEAIEKDDFDSLPGLLFARNFVKQYARALGLDPEPIVAELPAIDIAAAPMPEAPSRLMPGSSWDPSWNRGISSLAWFAVAVAAVVATYIHFNRPLQTQASSGTLIAGTAPQPEPARRPVEEAPARQSPQSAAAPLEKVAATAGARTNSGAIAQQAGDNADEANRKVNVSITAHEDSWIQVTADGKPVFTGTLKPNESKEISADDVVRLLAGNAGGITVSVNGRQLERIGASGQVKVLRLTEGGLQAALTSPAPADRL